MNITDNFLLKNVFYQGKSFYLQNAKNTLNVDVLIKFQKSDILTPEQIELIKSEYTFSQLLDTKYFLKPLEFSQSSSKVFITYESFNGTSLNEYVKEKRLLSTKDFLNISRGLIKAIGSIHDKGYVLKNINSNNIFIDYNTQDVKLVDLENVTELTDIQSIPVDPVSSNDDPRFLSPELTGRINLQIDYRTDWYSVGILFYWLITGQFPYEASDLMELVHKHLTVDPIEPHQINKNCPSLLSDIILKLLSKNVADRYKSSKGLIEDLNKIELSLVDRSHFENYKLGQKDFSETLVISEKFYGRERELDFLTSQFFKANYSSDNRVELYVAKGVSGIGKTTLLNEFKRNLALKGINVYSGKCDLSKRNRPYSLLFELFTQHARNLLSESEEELKVWKGAIQKAIGANGKIITDVIPDVELIIGKQKDVNELPLKESKNRFNLVFMEFIKVIATKKTPLVICIDDIQWIDIASLSLINSFIVNPDIESLFIIGALRDINLDSTDPIQEFIENFVSQIQSTNIIDLKPISLGAIVQLLSETLNRSANDCVELADVFYQKTDGNPFFIKHLLLQLHQEGVIYFETRGDKWNWELQKVRETFLTNNVIDIIIDKINRLSKEKKDILKYAAVIGNKFNLDILSGLCGKPSKDVLLMVKKLIAENIFVMDSSLSTQSDLVFKFNHDKIYQSCLDLIADSEYKEINYALAKTKYEKYKKKNLHEHIIDIALYYSEAKSLIKSEKESELVRDIFYQAAEISKNNQSYHTAHKCILDALNLCKQIKNHDTGDNFKINFLYCEILYQLGSFHKAEEVCEKLLSNNHGTINNLSIYTLMIRQQVVSGKANDALATGKKALSEIDININLSPGGLGILIETWKVKSLILGRDISSLQNLHRLDNKKVESAIEILITMCTPAYLVANQNLLALLTCKSVQLTIRHGLGDLAAVVFSGYGLIMRYMGKYSLATAYGELGLNLEDKSKDNVHSSMAYFVYLSAVHIWNNPMQHSLLLMDKAIDVGLKNGELIYTGYTSTQLAYGSPSNNLKQNLSRIEKLKKIVKVSDYQNVIDTIDAIHSYKKILHTEFPQKLDLTTEEFDESAVLARLYNDNYKPGIAYIHFFKICMAFYTGENEEGARLLETLDEYYDAVVHMRYEMESVFFGFLLLAQLDESASENHKKKMANYYSKIKKWNSFSNKNTSHILLAVEAERYRLKGDFNSAIDFYEKAIREAKTKEFIEHTGVIYLIMAKAFLKKGQEQLGKGLFLEACHWFEVFKAEGLIKVLFEKYNLDSGVDSARSVAFSQATSREPKMVTFDANSLVKASRVLSQEMSEERIHSELINIVLENAGANKVVFIEIQNNSLFIKARGEVGKQVEFLSEPLSSVDSGGMVKNIVYYTYRTLDKVIVSNSEDLSDFSNDYYIQNNKENLKSILCLPIINQGEILAILYLENNKIYHAFTKERLEVLNIITTQAAISLKNAELYSTLEQKVEQRAREVKEILHNIDEAILTIKPDLTFNEEHSHIAEEFFNVKDFTKVTFNDLFEIRGEDTLYSNDWLEKVFTLKDIGKWKLYKGISPLTRYTRENKGKPRYFEIDYQPIFEVNRVSKLMLVIKDVTKQHIAEMKMQENERAKRDELSKVHGIISNDREVIDNFITGLKEQIADLEAVQYKEILKNNELRNSLFIDVHTLKGNASSFGFSSITEAIHKLESQIHWEISISDKMSDIFQEWNNSIRHLRKEHEKIESIYNKIYNNFSKDEISVSKPKYLKLMNKIREENICENLFEEVKSLRHKSLNDCCQRLINTVKSYRDSTGKDVDDLFIVDKEKMVPRHVMEYLEGCFIHLVRNSLDHGIENNKERNETGKGIASIELAFHEQDGNYVITIADDGRGIDPKEIKQSAMKKGLMEEGELNQYSDKEVIDLIFHPEFSTSKTTNQISGRGMGMYAVRDTLEKVNGTIQIETMVGEGTKFTLTVPQNAIPIIN